MGADKRRPTLDSWKNLGRLGLGAALQEMLERRRERDRSKPVGNGRFR